MLMDKKAIKNFAVNAREKLRSDVTRKLVKLGITATGVEDVIKIGNDTIEVPSSGERFTGKDINSRKKLIEVLKNYENQIDPKDKKQKEIAFDRLVEEVAYTWFNRLVAIRFMEVNNYLPGRLRVLSSESGVREPDIITNILSSDLYSEMDVATKNRVVELMDDNSAEAVDELYQIVFIKQCNSLNKQLPELFEHIDDYTELLFTVSYIDENGVIASLLKIPESDFNVEDEGQVEIIGWMYQYYNTEPKDKVFARGRRKIRADEIPAATQLFTPDWIVRYMVENSLGRYYIDKKLASPTEIRTEKEIATEFGWKYYVPTAEQPEDVKLQIMDAKKDSSDFVLQELKLLDNAMGSGHVLVYAFDVFMQLYLAEGFRERDAAECIIKHNIFGLEIDKRAYQLAYFAIMMKGREYNRRILNKNIKLNLYNFVNSHGVSDEYYIRLSELSSLNHVLCKNYLDTLKKVVDEFSNATEIGSILKIENIDLEKIRSLKEFVDVFDAFSNMDILYQIPEMHEKVLTILNILEILNYKYTAIVTNPPYLNKMSLSLEKYVKKNYPDVKTDLFSVFIKLNSQKLVKDGYAGFMTPFVWMFIKSYEALRKFLITNKSISSLIQMEYSAFEEATVPICCFTIKNTKLEPVGNYFKLSDFRGGMNIQSYKVLEGIRNPAVNYFYQTNQDNFSKIPGQPISFWVSENLIKIFKNKSISKFADARLGMATADNNEFLRFWQEIDINHAHLTSSSRPEAVDSHKKWFPYDKGGPFRKWFGNNEYLVNWENDGNEIQNFKDDNGKIRSHNYNLDYIFKVGVTWSALSSGKFSCRYSAHSLFDNAGSKIFARDEKDTNYILGILNSPITNEVFKLVNPTMNYQPGTVASMVMNLYEEEIISNKVQQLIKQSKADWDTFEYSWDFKKHPLI